MNTWFNLDHCITAILCISTFTGVLGFCAGHKLATFIERKKADDRTASAHGGSRILANSLLGYRRRERK